MTDIEAVVERCCDAAWSQNYSMPRRKPRMMRALAALRPGDPLPGGNVVSKPLSDMSADEFMPHYRAVEREFRDRLSRPGGMHSRPQGA